MSAAIFPIGAKVAIAEGRVPGVVIGHYTGRWGLQYDVEYVTETGEIKSRWEHPDAVIARS